MVFIFVVLGIEPKTFCTKKYLQFFQIFFYFEPEFHQVAILLPQLHKVPVTPPSASTGVKNMHQHRLSHRCVRSGCPHKLPIGFSLEESTPAALAKWWLSPWSELPRMHHSPTSSFCLICHTLGISELVTGGPYQGFRKGTVKSTCHCAGFFRWGHEPHSFQQIVK